MLECINGSYYIGITTDVLRRYKEHERGDKKCKYTRSFPPRKLAAYWCAGDKGEAMQMEHKLKQLSHQEKSLLAKNPDLLLKNI